MMQSRARSIVLAIAVITGAAPGYGQTTKTPTLPPCNPCGGGYPSDRGAAADANRSVGTIERDTGDFSPRSAILLKKTQTARRLEARKKALQQAAELEVMTREFQKETASEDQLSSADINQLKEIIRLTKSIKSRLQE